MVYCGAPGFGTPGIKHFLTRTKFPVVVPTLNGLHKMVFERQDQLCKKIMKKIFYENFWKTPASISGSIDWFHYCIFRRLPHSSSFQGTVDTFGYFNTSLVEIFFEVLFSANNKKVVVCEIQEKRNETFPEGIHI